jgi:hypothetical protein
VSPLPASAAPMNANGMTGTAYRVEKFEVATHASSVASVIPTNSRIQPRSRRSRIAPTTESNNADDNASVPMRITCCIRPSVSSTNGCVLTDGTP